MSESTLKEASLQYEAGDVVAARRLATEASAKATTDAERTEAAQLLARTQAPLWVWRYVLGAAMVLVLMLALAITRG